MPKMIALSMAPRKNRLASFTLVELLFVMAIIAILAALTLAAGSGVMKKAARSRASSEIQAMNTALESYKTDNGIYPQVSTLFTNTYANNDGSGTTTNYQYSSQVLYQALSGQTNFNDTPVAGAKAYMSFKVSQVGNYNAPANSGVSAGSSYIRDPWGYSYGYSTGTLSGAATPSYPYNGSGFFDLWSTGGLLVANVNTNAWISNWQ